MKGNLDVKEYVTEFENYVQGALKEIAEKSLVEIKQSMFEISNLEKKLNECFCNECLDKYLSASYDFLTKEVQNHTVQGTLVNMRYFVCSRVLVILKKFKVEDGRFPILMKKFSEEMEIHKSRMDSLFSLKIQQEEFLDVFERPVDKSKRIKIIGWSLFGILSSLGVVGLIYYYKKKHSI